MTRYSRVLVVGHVVLCHTCPNTGSVWETRLSLVQELSSKACNRLGWCLTKDIEVPIY